jgi:tRNA (cytidine32/uridine32-2'-O)-methyltransferase
MVSGFEIMPVLKNVRVVLVRPTHPGNIGATARAMKNMSLEQLVLVEPLRYPDAEATARAAGAEDVLDRAVVCGSLDEAVAGCGLVVGTSARSRHIEWPILAPQEAAAKLVATASCGPVAVVFGQERIGLTNAELDRCRLVVSIPVNAEYPSLNLASAVQILAYEVFRAAGAGVKGKSRTELAGHDDMLRFYRHLEAVLVDVGFLNPDNPRLLMRRLMRLFNRAAPDQNELNILRGILTAVQATRRAKLDSESGGSA